jgi:hypothetical protein
MCLGPVNVPNYLPFLCYPVFLPCKEFTRLWTYALLHFFGRVFSHFKYWIRNLPSGITPCNTSLTIVNNNTYPTSEIARRKRHKRQLLYFPGSMYSTCRDFGKMWSPYLADICTEFITKRRSLHERFLLLCIARRKLCLGFWCLVQIYIQKLPVLYFWSSICNLKIANTAMAPSFENVCDKFNVSLYS